MTDNGALGALTDGLKKRVSRRDAAVFAMSFLIAAAAHLYAFTNKFINYDDLCEMFAGVSMLPSGRWLLHPVIKLTGRVSMPMVCGLVGSAFLALTVLTVLRTLRVRSTAACAAAALAMAAHPTVCGTWIYMFTAPAYFMAMFMAVLGVALIRRPGWRWFAPGAALIGMSMGCYQAELALASALAVLALIADICDGIREDRWKPVLLDCLKSLAGLAAGLVIYFIVLKLCLRITGTELLSYSGIDSMTDVDLKEILHRVGTAYRHFFSFRNEPLFLAVHRVFPAFLAAGTALSFLSALYLALRRKLWRSPLTLAVLLVLLAVLPLASDLVYVMAGEASVHWLMLYPTVLVWIFPAFAAERVGLPEKGSVRRLLAAACAVLLLAVPAVSGYESALISNKVYLELDLSRQNANNYITRVLTRVESQEGYTPDSKVAFIGVLSAKNVIPSDPLTGLVVGPNLLNIYSRGVLLSTYHSFVPGWVSQAETDRIAATPEFAAMPVYPADGSIRTIDGVITVKLS